MFLKELVLRQASVENIKDSCIFTLKYCHNFIRNKVFKNEPSKICGRQPLKFFQVIWFDEADHITSNVLKAVFHKFYLGHSLNTLFHLLVLYFQIHNNPDNEICAKLWVRIIKIICENSFIILIMKYLLLERYLWNNTCLNIVDVNEELCKPVYYSIKNITFEILKIA